jgi:hypothetical protein
MQRIFRINNFILILPFSLSNAPHLSVRTPPLHLLDPGSEGSTFLRHIEMYSANSTISAPEYLALYHDQRYEKNQYGIKYLSLFTAQNCMWPALNFKIVSFARILFHYEKSAVERFQFIVT